MLRRFQLERFVFLVDKKGSESRRYMLQDAIPLPSSRHSIKWAPRDCTHASSSYADFHRHGFDAYEVALSLVGYSGPKTNKYGSFARPQYTYVHMPFNLLAQFLTQLHPDDRFFAYIMTEATAPIHMYFDLDADLDKFPHLRGKDEECIRVFLATLRSFFRSCFHREINASGLLLLQATSSSKLSWHLHIHTEAFRDMQQHRMFVQQFRDWLEERQEQMDADAEAAPDGELAAARAAPFSLPLCRFQSSSSHSQEGIWLHIVDHAPYSKNQNLRAPYNRKPGKTALQVRKHEWDEQGELHVLPLHEGPAVDTVDPDVLFRAHPSLAQPSKPGYVHLTLAPQQTAKRGRKRQQASNDEEEREAQHSSGQTVSRTHSLSEPNKKKKKTAAAHAQNQDGERIALSSSEILAVKVALTPHLGAAIEFDEVYRWISGESELIKGITKSGTSDCPRLRTYHPDRSMGKHRSNRMCFELGMGWQKFHCFDADCQRHDVRVSWSVDEDALKLLTGQRGGSITSGRNMHSESSMVSSGWDTTAPPSSAPVISPRLASSSTDAQIGSSTSNADAKIGASLQGQAQSGAAAAGAASAASSTGKGQEGGSSSMQVGKQGSDQTSRAPPPGSVQPAFLPSVGLYEGWVDESMSSRARVRQLEAEFRHKEAQEQQRAKAEQQVARRLYEQQKARAEREEQEEAKANAKEYEEEAKQTEASESASVPHPLGMPSMNPRISSSMLIPESGVQLPSSPSTELQRNRLSPIVPLIHDGEVAAIPDVAALLDGDRDDDIPPLYAESFRGDAVMHEGIGEESDHIEAPFDDVEMHLRAQDDMQAQGGFGTSLACTASPQWPTV